MTFHGRENIEDILKVINNGKTTIALPSKKVRDMAQFLLDNGVDETLQTANLLTCALW